MQDDIRLSSKSAAQELPPAASQGHGVSGRPPCRACEKSIGMTRGQIRALAEKLRLDETQLLAPDDVYARRLDACEACGALLGGATCAHCGCIVPLRAMQLMRGCPHPEGPRW